ncbi:MAG: hypothetical protein WAW16_05220 [Candidatus Cryosericum sp.]
MRKPVAALTARTPVLSRCIIGACSWRVRFLPVDNRGNVMKLTSGAGHEQP